MNSIGRALRILRRSGFRVLAGKVARRLFPVANVRPTLVRYEDALAADWTAPHRWKATPKELPDGALVVAWVMSPPGSNSGGHQNIFRFIKVLEDAGHAVRIYLYSANDPTTPEDAHARVTRSSSFPLVNAPIARYPDRGVPDDVDVIVATGWETAYPSLRDRSSARRFYFVQDFEPLFYPASSEATLAENTYRFGFFGITAGDWLATILRERYAMSTAAYDFGADGTHYSISGKRRRDGVFFYARPETPRRGFELGVMALDLFARERPDCPIILAGQDLRAEDLPFAHENPGNMQVGELNAVYNRCAAGLVLSLTNLSLLPLELLAAGVIPVLNDAPNNRLVAKNDFIVYSEPSPRALADHLIAIVSRADQAEHAERAAASVRSGGWDASAKQFLEAFARGLRG